MESFKQFLENSQKTMIIISSPPGAGKSTLAKKLGQGGLVLSADDLFISPDGEYKFNPSLLKKNHQTTYENAKQALEKGISPVVIDNTNLTIKAVKPYVLLAQEYGYNVEFKEPDTPWKFDAEELAKRNKHGVSQKVIEKMLRKWVPGLTVDKVLNSDQQNPS